MINIKTAKRKYSVDIDGVSTGEVTCVEITNQDDTKNIVKAIIEYLMLIILHYNKNSTILIGLYLILLVSNNQLHYHYDRI